MRSKEKSLYKHLLATRADVKAHLQAATSSIEVEILEEEHSNLTTQITQLRRYLPSPQKKSHKGIGRQTSGAPKTLYAMVVPSPKRQQKRSYVKKRGKIQRHVPFTQNNLLTMPVAFIKDFSGEEYIFYSCLYHFDTQYAIHTKTRKTVPIETIFQQARNIRDRKNIVLASRKTLLEPLVRR